MPVDEPPFGRHPGPPDALLRDLVDGPSPVTAIEWHDEVASTNVLAAGAAARGVPEIHVVLADRQTAGRGRLDRTWEADAGTALLCSLVLRPAVPPSALSLLPLLAGLVLAEAVAAVLPGAPVALKWPNDLLLGDRKAAGILVEAAAGAVVVGIGLNVTAAPPGAAALGEDMDRWAVLRPLAAVLDDRYPAWQRDPTAFLDDYRRRCATLGQAVRVTRVAADPIEGTATDVAADGALVVRHHEHLLTRVLAGDVHHVRPA